jgi:endothelin-converting enzyme/putative endopeptidase
MNPDIRVQDDLFGHVNGRWLDTVEIPSDRSGWGPFIQLTDVAEGQVREIIADIAAQEPASLDEDSRKVAALYASFMDEGAVEALGLAPIQKQIDAIADVTDLRGLAAYLGQLQRGGGYGLFGWFVGTDDRDPDRYLVSLYQSGLGLPDESYYREGSFAEMREKYVDYLQRTFGLAGVADAADAEAAAASVLRIETALAGGHWDRVESRDVQKTYNLTTLEQLRELAPAFDWDAYIEALGGDAPSHSVQASFAETCVRQPSYLSHLSGVLTEIPIEDWRAWLLSRVVRSAAPYLSSAFVDSHFDFYGRTLSGTPELRPRWKRGVDLVQGAIGEAVGREYVARHFPPSAKATVDALVANLLAAYRSSIEALDWMGESTKQQAYEKLDNFRPKIGYPTTFRDYSAMDLQPGDLMANVAAAEEFETDRQLSKIGAPVDRDEWLMLPQTVNAYYNPGTNEICFPAGILQAPFFSPDADPAENYGGIGAVIGHEVGHGFDDQGAEYDGTGRLHDWWTAEDKAAFSLKSQGLIAQYDGFEPRGLPGQHVNGGLTVGENIGDLGGLTIAHKAYLISLNGEPVPERDGLTGTQRLFLSWGYIWRVKRRPEQEQQYLTIDPHSPAEFRANIVRNLDEFHDAFGTAEGDGLWLDPSARIRIW